MFSDIITGAGENNGSNTANNLIKRLSGPATLFWLGGLVGLISIYGWQILPTTNDVSQQLYWLIGGLIILLTSDVAMGWFTLPLLQLLEGYNWPEADRAKFVNRLRIELEAKLEEWDKLGKKDVAKNISPAEQRRYTQLEYELSLYPAKFDNLMPTKIGNILRAAEQYPHDHYGLESITVWPRLWVLLPDTMKLELAVARQNLDQAVQLFGWGLLFLVWAILAYWSPLMILAVPAGLLMIVGGYYRAISTAKVYGDMIRTAFDLYRFELYHALKLPLPANSEAEIEQGKLLTSYIFRGDVVVVYEHDGGF